MKKTPKQTTVKGIKPQPSGLPDGVSYDEHHHHNEDKELYIIEADGNVKKVDLHRGKEC